MAQEEPPLQEQLTIEEPLPTTLPELDISFEEEEPPNLPIIIPEQEDPTEPLPLPVDIPLDGLFEEISEVPAPTLAPAEETTPPLAPVALSVEVDRYILMQGEQAMLSVSAADTGRALPNDARLTLTLPSQLRIVGDAEAIKVWTYNADTLASPVHHTLTVEVNPTAAGALPAVVEILLEATIKGYETQRERWVLGIIGTNKESAQRQTTQSPNGTVLDASNLTLLIPADAAPAGVKLEYTPLITATEQASTVEEPSIPLSTSVQLSSSVAATEDSSLYIPSLAQSSEIAASAEVPSEAAPIEQREIHTSSIETIEDNGLSVYRTWNLAAEGLAVSRTTDAQPGDIDELAPAHPSFAEAVLMVVEVADLVEAGVDMSMVTLWTRPDAKQPWRRVFGASYDSERQVWVARLTHFSDFAIGINPSSSGELLPSMKGFSSDRNTGAATVHYPINAPSGLGGLNPNLSLTYSSQSVDDTRFALLTRVLR